MHRRTRARSQALIVVAAIGALMLVAAVGSGWLFAATTADAAECSRANPHVQETNSYLGQPAPVSEANWRETESNLKRLVGQLRSIKVLDRGELLADAVDNVADVASRGSADGWSIATERLRQPLVGMLDACGLSVR